MTMHAEPGSTASADVVAALPLRLVGAERTVGHDRHLVCAADVAPVPRGPGTGTAG